MNWESYKKIIEKHHGVPFDKLMVDTIALCVIVGVVALIAQVSK